jgi:iron complex transport system ATP-binding protein
MTELEAVEVTAGYGAENVLHGASITLCQGELVGVIGPNGCGKSSLLRCLSGIMKVRSGSVRLAGRDVAAWTPLEIARQLAFVPQTEPALFEFKVRDIVLMGRHPHLQRWKGETDADYQIVNEALEQADILHLADRPVTQLSGGEHRRMLLARALAQQTPLLLLDEPTAHLDITHQVEILTLVCKATQDARLGSIAALHDLNQAAEFCDRLVLMVRGTIVAQGTPDKVLTPNNLRIAYEADSRIGCNPATGRPMLLSVRPARATPEQERLPRIHVICGDGAGAETMRALVQAGYTVTAGVLNVLDADKKAAETLGISVVLEEASAEVGWKARAACSSFVAKADVVVVAPVQFERGNLGNLELALEAQILGKAIIMLESDEFAARDRSGGSATMIFHWLVSGGAVRCEDIQHWIAGQSETLFRKHRSD